MSKLGIYSAVSIALLGLLIFFLLWGDLIIVFNGQKQPIIIKSVKVNGQATDAARVSLPVTLQSSTGTGGHAESSLWLTHRSLSSDVKLSVDLIHINTGVISTESCVYRRMNRLHCSTEVSITHEGLNCTPCTPDF